MKYEYVLVTEGNVHEGDEILTICIARDGSIDPFDNDWLSTQDFKSIYGESIVGQPVSKFHAVRRPFPAEAIVKDCSYCKRTKVELCKTCTGVKSEHYDGPLIVNLDKV